jgi:hypothetical protein
MHLPGLRPRRSTHKAAGSHEGSTSKALSFESNALQQSFFLLFLEMLVLVKFKGPVFL